MQLYPHDSFKILRFLGIMLGFPVLVFWKLAATIPQDCSSITRNGNTFFNETRGYGWCEPKDFNQFVSRGATTRWLFVLINFNYIYVWQQQNRTILKQKIHNLMEQINPGTRKEIFTWILKFSLERYCFQYRVV